MYSRPQRDREYQDKVQGVQRRQCNTGVQWIRGLLRTSPLLQFPSQRRPLSKILSPAFTVQADETFKPRVQWSEMFRSYIERNQGGLERATLHNLATTELRSAWAVAAAVTGPVKVRVARYLRDSGVFTSHPKWDKSRSLLSCAPPSTLIMLPDLSWFFLRLVDQS